MPLVSLIFNKLTNLYYEILNSIIKYYKFNKDLVRKKFKVKNINNIESKTISKYNNTSKFIKHQNNNSRKCEYINESKIIHISVLE